MAREFFNNHFSPFERINMAAEANNVFSSKRINRTVSKERFSRMSDDVLLAFYTASKLSPAPYVFDNPDGVKAHNFINETLLNTVFSPDAPEFDPKETFKIIQGALFVARNNWQVVQQNPDESWHQREYARIMVEDINARLVIPELQSPKPQRNLF